MNRVIRQAFVRAVNFDARSITLVASTDQLCPDNMIILSKAWAQDYGAWLKSNPVVLGFHDYHSWAIGHVTDGRVENGQLVETIAFDDTNPEAIVAWSLYSKGHQRAASVGWDTLEADMDLPIGEVLARYMEDLSPDTVAQLTAEGKVNTGRKVTVVTRAQKLETSLVPVPMDDKAVVVHSTPEGLFSRAATPELLKAAEGFGVQFDKPCLNCRGEHDERGHVELELKFDDVLRQFVDANDAEKVELFRDEFEKRFGVRVGAMLSAANKAIVQSAIEACDGAGAALKELMAAAMATKGGEKEATTEELKARVERAEADAELLRKLKTIGSGT